jgi:hypothetical protein
MVSPTDHMFESSSSSIIEQSLSDERDLSQIESSKRKIISKRQQNPTNDMYGVVNRYHRLKPSSTETTSINQSLQQTKMTVVNEESIDSIWSSSGTSK